MLRLLDPAFVETCDKELAIAPPGDVFEAVRVFSRAKYCPVELDDLLKSKVKDSLGFLRDAELSELCLRLEMFPDIASPVLEEIRRRDFSPMHLAGAFCGLAQVRQLSRDDLRSLGEQLNHDDVLADLHPALVSTIGLAAATTNSGAPHFFARLYGVIDVSRLQGQHCANTWLMIATNGDWPVTFITRLEAQTMKLVEAEEITLDDCVTTAWALTSAEFTSEKLMLPLLERLVQRTRDFSVEQENQVHQIGLSMKQNPPPWKVPDGLLSQMPYGEQFPDREHEGRHQQSGRVEDFYHADILCGRAFVVARPEHERDPWVRLKKRHLHALGYEYMCIPEWDTLSDDERDEILKEFL